MNRVEAPKYPLLALRLELLRSVLEAGLADQLLAAIQRVGLGGEPFLRLETDAGVLLLPLCLEPVEL